VVFLRFRVPAPDAEDILQQALLALVYRWSEIRDPGSWLLGALRNKCLIYWRNRRRQLYETVEPQELEWRARPLLPEQEKDELWQDLEALVARLPPRCRTVLWLRYRLGYDTEELARALSYRPTSISKVTARCLESLLRLASEPDRRRLARLTVEE
jgi:RNA polymerase sigma factor (sigma-70 family)